jgi:hypothetical protein
MAILCERPLKRVAKDASQLPLTACHVCICFWRLPQTLPETTHRSPHPQKWGFVGLVGRAERTFGEALFSSGVDPFQTFRNISPGRSEGRRLDFTAAGNLSRVECANQLSCQACSSTMGNQDAVTPMDEAADRRRLDRTASGAGFPRTCLSGLPG